MTFTLFDLHKRYITACALDDSTRVGSLAPAGRTAIVIGSLCTSIPR